MKTILIIFCATILFSGQSDETYHVIKINGNIVNIKSGSTLQPGASLKPSDELQFQSEGASALVISSSRGKFTLSMPEQEDIFGESDQTAFASSAIAPISSRSQLSPRGIAMSTVKDLKSFLGDDDFTVIGDDLSIKLDASKYELNDKKYFTYKLESNNKEIKDKFNFEGQNLLIQRQKLVGKENTDEKDKYQKLAVYEVNEENQSEEEITVINLHFKNKEELVNEFKIIISVLQDQGLSRAETNNFLYRYFSDVYGRTDSNYLFLLINKTYKSEAEE